MYSVNFVQEFYEEIPPSSVRLIAKRCDKNEVGGDST